MARDQEGRRSRVAGVDTIRGIGFQQASALSDAIDLVTNPDAAVLRVEGIEDIVDYQTLTADGRRLWVGQAKTRQAPRTWSAGDIAEILGAWDKLSDADGAEFAFVTEGQRSETGVAVGELIQAVRAAV